MITDEGEEEGGVVCGVVAVGRGRWGGGGGGGQRGLRGEGGRRTPSCFVIPANAGTQSVRRLIPHWVPAFAGMTMVGVAASALHSQADGVRQASVGSRRVRASRPMRRI